MHRSIMRKPRFTIGLLWVGLYLIAPWGWTAEEVPTVTPAELYALLQQKSAQIFLLDVRTPEEYREAHIPQTDARIDYRELERMRKRLPKDPDTPIIVYCRSGRRSAIALQTLRKLGYTNVRHLQGGIRQWIKQGYPVESETP